MAAQVGSTFALALTLIFAPGLIAGGGCRSRDVRTALLLGTGPLLLALIGWAAWCGVLGSTSWSATIGIVILWLAIGVGLWRGERWLRSWSPHTRLMLGVASLIAVATVAKASYSGGPRGELYHGSIYRTLAVGDRSDARIPFFVVQLVAHRRSPVGPEADQYFTPWSFFSRGPLAGLIAAPVVLGTGGRPPLDFELRNAVPFDAFGYATYRITLGVLASAVIVAFYRALGAVLRPRWALVGAMLFATTPFIVHEVMFTWPKLPATTCLIVGFLFAQRRRPALAGVSLGLGYLFHPLAALWFPWLGLWVLWRAQGGHAHRIRAGLPFAVAAALVMLPWAAAGQLAPRAPGATAAGQSGFVSYMWLAEQGPATWPVWRDSRLCTLANTFVPFWLHAVNRDHPVLNGTHARSDVLVKFSFGWWTTLPLGAGLLLWACGLTAVLSVARRLAWPLFVLFVGPAVLLTVYWGGVTTGLMRECGHPLLPAFVGLGCAAAAMSPRRLPRIVILALFHPIAVACRCGEVLLMLWLTTLLNDDLAGGEFAVLDGVYIALSFCAIVAVAIISVRVPHCCALARAKVPERAG